MKILLLNFEIQKRCQKYFTCTVESKHIPVKMAINSISNSFQAGQLVCIIVEQLPRRSMDRGRVIFNPLAEVDSSTDNLFLKGVTSSLEAEIWLLLAIRDAADGKTASTYISKAMELIPDHPDLARGHAKLMALVRKNNRPPSRF